MDPSNSSLLFERLLELPSIPKQEIFKHIDLNERLSLRLVCKAARTLADENMNEKSNYEYALNIRAHNTEAPDGSLIFHVFLSFHGQRRKTTQYWPQDEFSTLCKTGINCFPLALEECLDEIVNNYSRLITQFAIDTVDMRTQLYLTSPHLSLLEKMTSLKSLHLSGVAVKENDNQLFRFPLLEELNIGLPHCCTAGELKYLATLFFTNQPAAKTHYTLPDKYAEEEPHGPLLLDALRESQFHVTNLKLVARNSDCLDAGVATFAQYCDHLDLVIEDTMFPSFAHLEHQNEIEDMVLQDIERNGRDLARIENLASVTINGMSGTPKNEAMLTAWKTLVDNLRCPVCIHRARPHWPGNERRLEGEDEWFQRLGSGRALLLP